MHKISGKLHIGSILTILALACFAIMGLTLDQTQSTEVAGKETTIRKKTNLEQLKASKYTGEKFEQIKSEDTKNALDNKFGEGKYLGETESGYEVYNYSENKQSTYQVYYKDDKLKEVGVILNN